MRKNKGFLYFLSRVCVAGAALLLGAGLYFVWALGLIDYVNIGAVGNNQVGIEDYEELEENHEKFSHLTVNIDSRYPIKEVEQKDKDIENILVFGIDSRGEEVSRADSIIIVTIDKRHGEIKLSSVLRDTQMHMNSMNGDTNKVNASYAFGGVGMLINTLNTNLDLDIQRFVMFDFWSSVKFVDALGGVNIEIEEQELTATNEVISGMARLMDESPDQHYLTQAGRQKLNGIQAISWSRIRKIDSDFGRTSRQRELMETIIRTFNQRNIFQQAKFGIEVLSELESNLNRSNMLRLGFNALGGLDEVHQYYVPQDGMYWTNTNNWNMIYDPELQIPALHNFIWTDQEE